MNLNFGAECRVYTKKYKATANTTPEQITIMQEEILRDASTMGNNNSISQGVVLQYFQFYVDSHKKSNPLGWKQHPIVGNLAQFVEAVESRWLAQAGEYGVNLVSAYLRDVLELPQLKPNGNNSPNEDAQDSEDETMSSEFKNFKI